MTFSQLFNQAEAFIVCDRRFIATLTSYAFILLVFVNLTLLNSPILGAICAAAYFLLNGIFLGHVFFRRERWFLRTMLGILILIAFLGLASWATMTAYNLDETRSVLSLFIVATLSSMMNRLDARHRGVKG